MRAKDSGRTGTTLSSGLPTLLSKAQGSTTRLWYQYDNLGNRALQNVNNLLTTYAYNTTNNELKSWSSPNGAGTTYTFDKNGNLLTRNPTGGLTRYYTWDVPGHLLKASTVLSVQGYYAYDGLGRRIEAKEGSTTTFYAYRGTDVLADGLGGTGVPNYDYIYANGLRIAKITSGGTSNPSILYYHSDALGSTRLITTQNGSVQFSNGYQPYGEDNGTPTAS